ncbi:MAG: hypothetical protein LBJ20_01690 [Candidatus Methanoplasma sp.]|jgi:hypothetical protein|nr:hypothetical protein [Candidatus Methanoplasma sp.]
MVAPIIIGAYAALVTATGLAYLYLIGIFAFALGFAAVGVVKLARKKWVPGTISLLLALGTALYALGYIFAGGT